MTLSGQPSVEWETLGQAIRARRLERGLTLVDLAAKVQLSQPFLSQIENGRARPSMMSLYRVAGALDTTPQAFFGGPSESSGAPTLVRADAARAVEVAGETAASLCRLLLAGDAPFHVLEFHGLPQEFLEYWEHDGFEAAYVIAGEVELDVAGTITTLHAGDFLSYAARLPHRLRSPGRQPAHVLLVETRAESPTNRVPANHVAATGRKRTTRTVKAPVKAGVSPKRARRARA